MSKLPNTPLSCTLQTASHHTLKVHSADAWRSHKRTQLYATIRKCNSQQLSDRAASFLNVADDRIRTGNDVRNSARANKAACALHTSFSIVTHDYCVKSLSLSLKHTETVCSTVF